jgi:glycosyltransferase involved in cell wall biosynthesis
MLEAMALGTVVVSRPVGGIPEVLNDNQTGILLKNIDARAIAEVCSKLLVDAQRRSRIADAARELLERQYSHEHNCDQVISLYHSLRKNAVEKDVASSISAVPVIEPPL